MPNSASNFGYAGDLSATEAWSLLTSDPKAQLVDVRTTPEWTFVGVPDLSGIGRETRLIEWQRYPTMETDADAFAEEATRILRDAGAGSDTPLLFLCRSGARSRAAAIAMTARGFSRAYNVAGGFEGDLDTEKHRGRKNGWKVSGLPWRQS